MEQKAVDNIQIKFLDTYLPGSYTRVKSWYDGKTIIKCTAAANYALTLRKYITSDSEVITAITCGDPEHVRGLAYVPVKLLYRSARERDAARAFILAELAKVKELKSRSAAVLKLLPRLLKDQTSYKTRPATFTAIYGDIAVTEHELTTATGYYKFVTLP